MPVAELPSKCSIVDWVRNRTNRHTDAGQKRRWFSCGRHLTSALRSHQTKRTLRRGNGRLPARRRGSLMGYEAAEDNANLVRRRAHRHA
jgi:hypothetical protein